MRNLLSITALFVIMVLAAPAVYAQAKFGHINSNELLQVMPGRAEAQQQLEAHARSLEEMFTAMQTEFQTKYTDFLQNEATFTELIRQSRQRELVSLQERIQEFQESAQQDLLQKENQLLSPIIESVRQAIEAVAKENGYTYVFDTSAGTVLFAEPANDIMPKVRAKLGIQ